jgi:hypothetical protein
MRKLEFRFPQNYIPGPLTLDPVFFPVNLTASEKKNWSKINSFSKTIVPFKGENPRSQYLSTASMAQAKIGAL